MGKFINYPTYLKDTTMRRHIYIAFCIVVTLALAAGNLLAQKSFKEFSQSQASKWKANRAIAESIATANNIPIRVKQVDGSATELQRFDNGIPVVYTTDNLTSAKTISTNKTWSGAGYGYALSGSPDTLGEWDGGAPLSTHQEYTSRILSTEGSLLDHSGHVAGTLIAAGVQANAHGMSYQAKLMAYDWNNDAAEMALAAAAGMRTSNHSYGRIVGWYYNYFGDSRWVWFGDTTISGTQDYEFGFYDSDAKAWDDVANGAPYYLICKAAGNDRGEGGTGEWHWVFTKEGSHVLSPTFRPKDGGSTGFRTVSSVGTAKNILTVGAVNGIPAGYSQPSDVVMTSFSCWGPCDDGRIKPDVVADGVNMYSCLTSSNTAYGTMSGTSMATPSVTGSVGILLHHQKNLHGDTPLRSSTMKAIIIHTADDAGNTGPDYKFGWGLMNTLSAIKLMTLDSADGSNSHISELQLSQGDTLRDTVYCNGTQPIKATICWNDPSGTPPPASLNPTTHMLVNDLDMRIIKVSNASVYSPWVLDLANPSNAATTGDNNVDNVEQVITTDPVPGAYIIKISHKGTTLSGGSQIFSLIVTGNVPYNSALVSASGGSYSVAPGTTVPESLKVYNKGTQTLTYTLSALDAWLTVNGSPVSIAPMDSTILHFTINAGTLKQWTEYLDTIDVASNDTVHPHYKIPVTIETSGPKLSMPAVVSFNADSGYVDHDLLWVHNTGTTPLTFTVTDTTSVPWLAIGSVPGPIPAGDSVAVNLTFDATGLTTGTRSAPLKFVSNDSSTGTLVIQLDMVVLGTATALVQIADRWNLVSVPVIPTSLLASYLYPTASSFAYAYTTVYVQHDTLARGIGYWMKFSGRQSVPVHGFMVRSDSFHVNIGWNLIGALSYPVPITMITTNTSGLTTSDFYGYSSGYLKVDTLKPGMGYWVKVTADGYLSLNSLVTGTLANRIVIVPISELPPSPPSEHTPKADIPRQFALEQAYPNPFNPSTIIDYALPTAEYVTLKIYNILGQEAYTAVDGKQDAGYKSVRVDFNNMPSGVYIYRITAGSFMQTKKMILAK
jgi:hypothetical protein